MSLTVGSRLGHYDVTALIGEGGMGQVGLRRFGTASLSPSRLLKKSVEWDRQIDPGVLPCSQYC